MLRGRPPQAGIASPSLLLVWSPAAGAGSCRQAGGHCLAPHIMHLPCRFFFALVPLFCLNAPLQTSPWGLGGAREGLQSIPALSRERAVASVGFRCEKAVCWCCLSPPVVRDVPCPCALPRLWEVPGELPRLGWWAASLLPSPCPPCICTPLWRPAAAESLAWLVQFQSTK